MNPESNKQAKDIPEKPILEYLLRHRDQWCFWNGNDRNVMHAMPEGTPPKVALAKMEVLIRKGLVDGCSCGCRGDFEITKAGEDVLLNDQVEARRE